MEGGGRSPRRRLAPSTPTAQTASIHPPSRHRTLTHWISWTPPTIGGRPCKEEEFGDYQLWYQHKSRPTGNTLLSPKTSNTADWKEAYIGKQTEWEMKPLIPGERYAFRVSVCLPNGGTITSDTVIIKATSPSQPRLRTPTSSTAQSAGSFPITRPLDTLRSVATSPRTTPITVAGPSEKDPAPKAPHFYPAPGAETPSGNKRISGFTQLAFVVLLTLYIMTHAWFLQAIVYKIGDDDMEPVLPHLVVDPLPSSCGECETGTGFTWPITGHFSLPSTLTTRDTNALSGSQGLWSLASSDGEYWYSPSPPSLLILRNGTQTFRLPGNCMGLPTAPIYLVVGLMKEGQYDQYRDYARGQKVHGPPFDDRFSIMNTVCGVSCGGALPHAMANCLSSGSMNWTKLVTAVSLGTALPRNRYAGGIVTHTFVFFALMAFVVRVFGFFPGLAFVWPPAPPPIHKLETKLDVDTDDDDGSGDEHESVGRRKRRHNEEKKHLLLGKKKEREEDRVVHHDEKKEAIRGPAGEAYDEQGEPVINEGDEELEAAADAIWNADKKRELTSPSSSSSSSAFGQSSSAAFSSNTSFSPSPPPDVTPSIASSSSGGHLVIHHDLGLAATPVLPSSDSSASSSSSSSSPSSLSSSSPSLSSSSSLATLSSPLPSILSASAGMSVAGVMPSPAVSTAMTPASVRSHRSTTGERTPGGMRHRGGYRPPMASLVPVSPDATSGPFAPKSPPRMAGGSWERRGPIQARLASLTCCAPGESAIVILRNLMATFEGLLNLRDKVPSMELISILFEDTEKVEEPTEANRAARAKKAAAVAAGSRELSVRLGLMNGPRMDSHHIARVWRNLRDWLLSYPGTKQQLRNQVQLVNHLLREWQEDAPTYPNDEVRELLIQLVSPSTVKQQNPDLGEVPWVDEQRRECQQYEFEGIVFKYMFHCSAIGSHPGDTGKGAAMQTVVRHIKGFENLRESEKNQPGGKIRMTGPAGRDDLLPLEQIPLKRIYLALLDSRHAPLAQFFNSCMPFFFRASKRPRFVQGRQFFGMVGTSDDAVDRRGEYFFEYICFLRNFAGVCSSCGTNAVWSMADWARTDQPFNYESTSLIEDTETSQRVHDEGELTEYLPKPLVHGLAKPPREYLKAQIRWSTGAVELWTHWRMHWQISIIVALGVAFEQWCITQGFAHSDIVGLIFPSVIFLPLMIAALGKCGCVRGLQHRIVMWLNTWYWLTGMCTSIFYCLFLPAYVSLYGGIDLNLQAMVGGMLISQLIDYMLVWIVIRWSPTIHSTYFLRSFQNWIPAWASGIAATLRGLRRASPICPNKKGACCHIGWNADPWVLKVELVARFGQLLLLAAAIVVPFAYAIPDSSDYGKFMAAAGAALLLMCALPPTVSLVLKEGSRNGVSSQWLLLGMSVFAFVFLAVSDSRTLLRQSKAYLIFDREDY